MTVEEYERADALYRSGWYQEACDAFAGLLLDPDVAADELRLMRWNMAMCCAHLGDFPAAIEHIAAGQWAEHDFWEAATAAGLQPPA